MRYKILSIILLIIVAAFIVTSKKNTQIVSPVSKQNINQNYNVPKEIKYDDSTDLKNELDSVNPEVLDSDFVGI